ncbi:MAG: hypothetical protein HZA29_01515 [Candidatus Omnitrophica bacterium]|nr:hypothetical protein [Candidatus Omnitrophota bacterium]
MTLFRIFLLMFIVVLLTGCAKLQYMDQLLTLKAVSDEQTQMGKEIERQDARFERLVAAVEEGSIGKYKDQKSVQHSFGDPVYVTQADGLDVWVYRYAAQFFDSPKVYLYWDQSGQLVQWKYEEGQSNGKIKQEAASKI